MMRSDKLNRNDLGGYTETTPPFLNVNVSYEDKSKQIIVHETLSENYSTDVSESERNIVNETLSQKNSMDVPESTITELGEEEHKELSVTQTVTSYFNIFECGRSLLDQLYVTFNQCSWPHQHKMNTIRR